MVIFSDHKRTFLFIILALILLLAIAFKYNESNPLKANNIGIVKNKFTPGTVFEDAKFHEVPGTISPEHKVYVNAAYYNPKNPNGITLIVVSSVTLFQEVRQK